MEALGGNMKDGVIKEAMEEGDTRKKKKKYVSGSLAGITKSSWPSTACRKRSIC